MAFEIPLLSCAHNPIVIPHGFVYPCFAVFTKQLLVRDRNQKKKYMGRMYCVLATKDQRHVFSGSGSSSRLQPACSASYRWLPLPYFDPPCSRLSHPSVVGPCTARCPVINRNIDDVV
jgi:hypothetical protein